MVRKLEVKSNLEKIIEKGGSVSADKSVDKKEWRNILIRLRSDMIQELDNVLNKRIGLSRNAWILEAIQEKLRKENDH